MSRPSITYVIPTKDRPRLAAAAIRALLRHPGDDIRVVVSDTSAERRSARWLERACRRRSDPRLIYLRAPEESIGTHWEWALEQALERTGSSHFTVHYDRKVLKADGPAHLLSAVARHKQRVVSYPVDNLSAERRGVRLWQPAWDGRDYLVSLAEVARMTSVGHIAEMGQAWPILSNCVVSRDTLGAIRERFGAICEAAAPDVAFAFRLCVVEQHSVHLDRPIAMMWGIQRSAGLEYLSGMWTDRPEPRWGDRPWMDTVTLPGINLGSNLLFHEYELTRRVAPELPPLSPQGYLDELAQGLRHVRDPARRQQLEAELREHGWAGEPPLALRHRPRPAGGSVVRQLAALIRGWPQRHPITRTLLSGLRARPDHITGHWFPSQRLALRCAVALPRCADPALPPAPEHGRALLATPIDQEELVTNSA